MKRKRVNMVSFDGTATPLETEREEDGRWIAEYVNYPGALAYGKTRKEAIANARKIKNQIIKENRT
jgi:predicted RNase H-like HicB family nuclease